MDQKLLIGIGAEIGTRKAPKLIADFQTAINRGFFANQETTHFRSLNGLHVALRVSGDTKTFKGKGVETPRMMKGKPYVTIEWVLTEDDWKNRKETELVEVLSDGLTEAFGKCVLFAQEQNEVIDSEATEIAFKQVLEQVRNDLA